MSGIIGKRESRGSGIVAGQVPANADIDHDALANFAAGEHYTQANITTLGTVTTGSISTGAIIDDPTMTQGSDATGDVYYRAASGKLTRLATGADGTVLTSTGAGAVPAFEAIPAGSITEADSWNLTANNADNGDITANWARVTAYGQIGTGLGESSGIFSFPSLGIWLISVQGMFTVRTSTDYYDLNLLFTVNNSDYNPLATAGGGNGITNISPNNNISLVTMIDVTNISNVKFKWNLSSMSNSTLLGDTTYYYTRFVAIRLGDT